MENKNFNHAKTLLFIPAILFALMIVCFALASALEFPTNRGAVYSIFALISILIFFLAPLPCAVISIIGAVFLSKAKKESGAKHGNLSVLAAVDVIISVILMTFSAFTFISGQSI